MTKFLRSCRITQPGHARTQGTWEAHRKYIDVQFVAAGVEEMGYANVKTLTIKKSYDERDDYSLFDGAGSFVTIPTGSFTFFFPEDGHIPGAAADENQRSFARLP